jgi:hypothetical protein
MAESSPLEDIKKDKKSSHVRYFKMKVLDTAKSEDINETVKESISEKKYCFE